MTRGPDDDELVPEQTSDDRDRGWGDDLRGSDADPDDLRRFLDDVPPHHGS